MSIIVNTNVQSIKIQNSLNTVTNSMNRAMERMTSGSKVNRAGDDAAGFVISKGIEVQASGSKVAKSNAQTGSNLLETAEGNLNVMQDNLIRVRDLTLQAMNGGQTVAEINAMQEEVLQRLAENDRLATGAKFNAFNLFDDNNGNIVLQVGTGSDKATNTIEIKDVFKGATTENLTTVKAEEYKFLNDADPSAVTIKDYATLGTLLNACDKGINAISTRRGTIGAVMNRIDSATSSLDTQYANLTAAGSRIKDTDIAEESSNYTKYNILQQASAALLVQANQTPQIALSLI